jgi:hypothetical protein
MSSARPAPVVIASGLVAAVVAVAAMAGIVPALVVLWTGSLAGVIGMFVYEGRQPADDVLVAASELEPVARVEVAVSPFSEAPLVVLADSGVEGPHGKLTHRHRRHRSHEALRARV